MPLLNENDLICNITGLSSPMKWTETREKRVCCTGKPLSVGE